MSEVLVNVDVAALEPAIAFYRDGLGLAVRRRLGPDIAELTGTSSRIFLTEQPAGTPPFPGAAVARQYERHWTPVHVDFVVGDLESAVRRAESAGARREGPLREFSWGRYAVMSDPFGNGFCLLQFRSGDYDEEA